MVLRRRNFVNWATFRQCTNGSKAAILFFTYFMYAISHIYCAPFAGGLYDHKDDTPLFNSI